MSLYPRKTKIEERLIKMYEEETRKKLLELFETDYGALEDYREGFSKLFGEPTFQIPPEEIAKLLSGANSVLHDPVPLPWELIQNPVTRENFSRGIAILTAQMDRFEKLS